MNRIFRKLIGITSLVFALTLGPLTGLAHANCTVNGADHEGTLSNDVIVCKTTTDASDNLPTYNITGLSGNDTITNTGDIGSIFGDSIDGPTNTGNDLITNTGIVAYNIYGDSNRGNTNAGDDIIINSGSARAIYGDSERGTNNTGNDAITNMGVVDTIYGDSDRGHGTNQGDDTINNTGVVNYNIYGDSHTGANNAGNDTVINAGSVAGSVITRGGDDTVILTGNASVDGIINGGNGGETTGDTLVFAFTSASQAEIDAFNAALAVQSPTGGSVTWRNETFFWKDFEFLSSQVTLSPPSSLIGFGY